LLHVVGGLLARAELAGQIVAGDAFLGGVDEVGGEEPGGQVELGVLEDRAGGDAGLFAAFVALEQFPGLDKAPVLVFAAVGACEALFVPAGLAQALSAGILVAVALVEVQQAGWVGHARRKVFSGQEVSRERFGR
jgi:hypothetical protein